MNCASCGKNMTDDWGRSLFGTKIQIKNGCQSVSTITYFRHQLGRHFQTPEVPYEGNFCWECYLDMLMGGKTREASVKAEQENATQLQETRLRKLEAVYRAAGSLIESSRGNVCFCRAGYICGTCHLKERIEAFEKGEGK